MDKKEAVSRFNELGSMLASAEPTINELGNLSNMLDRVEKMVHSAVKQTQYRRVRARELAKAAEQEAIARINQHRLEADRQEANARQNMENAKRLRVMADKMEEASTPHVAGKSKQPKGSPATIEADLLPPSVNLTPPQSQIDTPPVELEQNDVETAAEEVEKPRKRGRPRKIDQAAPKSTTLHDLDESE